MKNLIFILILFNSTLLSAQVVNLVPNYSFEKYDTCPVAPSQIYFVQGWMAPTYGSPDYFNSCSASNWYSTPQNVWGYQYPKTGNAYVGVSLFNKVNFYREYIAVKLDSELVAGRQYCVNFYVSFADSCNNPISSIGALLLNQQTFFTTGNIIPTSPQLINPATNYIDSKENWILFSKLYTSLGGEQYLIIGNFENDANTDGIVVNDGSIIPTAFYFIDDVYVGPCEESLAIPNVFTPNGDGINDFFAIPILLDGTIIHIYNRWGRIVYSSANYQNDWNGENLNDGVYYYIVQLPFGTTKKGTVTILRN